MSNKKLAVLIPVHELNDETTVLFENAVKSVKDQSDKLDIFVVAPKSVKLPKSFKGEVIVNDGQTDFCTQVNLGAKFLEGKYEYFSLLEFDDVYKPSYSKNVLEHIEAYPNVGVFLTILNQVGKDGEFIGYTNEAAWAETFSEKVGFLDLHSLMQYESFSTSGAVFKVSNYNEVGGYKADIKVYYMYELLLRFVNEDTSIMVIPKMIYTHLNYRTDSQSSNYKDPIKGITPEEAYFYLETARKEYFFNPSIKRDIKFVPASVAG